MRRFADRMFLILNVACLAVVCLLIPACKIHAATLEVGGTDPSDYSTIQAALDDAVPGDTVFVYAGIYNENVLLKDGVRLQGEGADVTYITGQQVAGAIPSAVTARRINNAVISGFSITGVRSAVAASYVIYADSASVQITRCIIGNATIGIYAVGSDITVTNNVLYLGSSDGGIYIQSGSGVIKNNIIVNGNTGIYVTGRSSVNVSFNDVFNCTTSYSGTGGGTGAISLDPLFAAPAHNDFRLTKGSPCIDAGDPSDAVPPHGGNRIDMGAFEYEFWPEMVEGPQATVISDTEARIVWQLNTPCDARIDYGMTADSFDQHVEENALSTIHSITLSGLSPSTTYQYMVSSTDNGGYEVKSEPAYFTTLPAPDSAPPLLETNIPEVVTGPVAVHAEASDDTGVESLEFYVDDTLNFTLFGDSCNWLFDPSVLSNGSHTLRVVTRDMSGRETMQQALVTVALQPADETAPLGGIISPSDGATVSGGSVDVEAWGMDPESGIKSMLFYVDDELLHEVRLQGEPGVDQHASWQWNSFGSENNQDHEIRVEVVNNRDMAVSESTVVHVSNTGSILDEADTPMFKFKLIKLTRGQVKRNGTYYEARLYVQNISPLTLEGVTVYDTHAGFQAIQSDYGYAPKVRFEPDTFSSVVMFEIGSLHPGEVKELTVDMSTVLVSPDPQNFDYVIGKETEVDYLWKVGTNYEMRSLIYHLPAAKTIEGWWGTDEIPLNTSTVLAPVAECDYLVVTHPRNLYSNYDIVSVDDLLSECARFIHYKDAVLAYVDSPAPRSELMNLIGHKNAVPLSGASAAGGWSNLLRPGWNQDGYMLIVGETEIIPSFTIILTIPKGQYTVPLCDQPYADLNDDGYPDLILGRIIGDSAVCLEEAIKTSRLVQTNAPGYQFDASDALLISGKGNYETSFVNNVNEISSVMNTLYEHPLANDVYHRTDYSSYDYLSEFLSLLPAKDILYYNGHGSPTGWAYIISRFDLHKEDFAGTNPVILSFTCSTGYYEAPEDASYSLPDWGIGEDFFTHGAGLFIGATRGTNTGFNSNNGLLFFRDFWRPQYEIGSTFRNMERYLWSQYNQNPYNWRFVLGYNIYGDPKFGSGSQTKALSPAFGKGTGALQAKGDVPEGLDVQIPDYTVTSIDGTDYVQIPGGQTLIDPGQYQVPYWVETVMIPAGHVVQDVTMVEISEPESGRGLHLPLSPTDFLENDEGEPFVPEEHVWYPDIPFRYEVIPDDNGGQMLVLMIYPFSYNSETTEFRFFNRYGFSFSITQSMAEITDASVKKEAVLPGQPIDILTGMNNLGEDTLTTRLRAVIRPYAGKNNVDGLPIHTLELPPGHSALVESWPTEGIPDGHYRIEVILEDMDGNVLDTAAASFTLGEDTADICFGDSEADGDVDGADLASFIENRDFIRLNELAANYGWICN